MANNKNNIQQITANTQIVFTVKMFFTVIGSILGIFYLFYTLVIKDTMDDLKAESKELRNIASTLQGSVGTLNSNVESLSQRFNDLKELKNNETTTNTSGGFGGQ